jgi:hypothetical protein
MDQTHKTWNENQKILRRLLSPSGDCTAAISLFTNQHSALHSSQMSQNQSWSLSDDVLQGLEERELRCIPPGSEHSILWVFWHLARIEDVTMNLLVAGLPQLFLDQNWYKRLGYDSRDTGNSLDPFQIVSLSQRLDINALFAYRFEVGLRTRSIVSILKTEDLMKSVPASRLEQVITEGAVDKSTRYLVDYWGSRNIAGLLLMPPTRHNFLHLNEATRIRKLIERHVT